MARALIRHNAGNTEILLPPSSNGFGVRGRSQRTQRRSFGDDPLRPRRLPVRSRLHGHPSGSAFRCAHSGRSRRSCPGRNHAQLDRELRRADQRHFADTVPEADVETRQSIATGLTSLFFTVDLLSVLGETKGFATAIGRPRCCDAWTASPHRSQAATA